MVDFERIERLKQEYSDKFVVVDSARPELARFRDVTGLVKTVNMSGRALVEFDAGDNNIGWYDIELDFLKIIDKPLAKKITETAKPEAKKATAKPPAAGAAKTKPKSTADILAAARGGGKPADKSVKADSPAGKKPMSTADILAAARGKESAGAESATVAAGKPDESKGAKQPMSTADILAAARGGAKSAAASTIVEEEPAAEPPAAEAPEVEEAPAVEEPVATESSVVDESPAEPAGDAAAASSGELPTTVEGIIAWCQEHDGG